MREFLACLVTFEKAFYEERCCLAFKEGYREKTPNGISILFFSTSESALYFLSVLQSSSTTITYFPVSDPRIVNNHAKAIQLRQLPGNS